jgi:hypothetical protein
LSVSSIGDDLDRSDFAEPERQTAGINPEFNILDVFAGIYGLWAKDPDLVRFERS